MSIVQEISPDPTGPLLINPRPMRISFLMRSPFSKNAHDRLGKVAAWWGRLQPARGFSPAKLVRKTGVPGSDPSLNPTTLRLLSTKQTERGGADFGLQTGFSRSFWLALRG